MFLGAFDGVAFLMQQSLDLEQSFDIPAAVQTMPGTRLAGANDRELGLPVTQDVWLDADDPRHFPDLEVQLVGQLGSAGAHHRLTAPSSCSS
jgi:hypothetical protein